VGTYKTPGEYQYQMLRCNVDMLKLIQARHLARPSSLPEPTPRSWASPSATSTARCR